VDHVCVTDVCGLATFNLKSSWRNSGWRRPNTINILATNPAYKPPVFYRVLMLLVSLLCDVALGITGVVCTSKRTARCVPRYTRR